MTKVICIAHQKGGVGKSTLALNLYNGFQNTLKVCLIDADPQGSLVGLKSILEELNIEQFQKNIDKHKVDNDLIIIDTPPYLSAQLPELFISSDFVLIPTKAGFFDLMAAKSTIAMFSNALKIKTTIKAGIVFNMVRHNSSISKELRDLILNDNVPILNSIISERVSYTRSLISGGIFNSTDEKAKTEIVNLADEILINLGI